MPVMWMNSVSVPPMGRPLNAGYSSTAGSVEHQLDRAGLDDREDERPRVGHGLLHGETEHVAIERDTALHVGHDEIGGKRRQLIRHRAHLSRVLA
jgi:hypothetical protein